MLDLPQVSIVIPALELSHVLKPTLESCFAQKKYQPEVIVVDDGSKQPLRPQLEKTFPKVVWLRNAISQGPSHSRNKGLAKARAEHVLFLDSDDILSDDFCSKMLRSAQRADTSVVCLSKTSFSQDIGLASRLFLKIINAVRNVFLRLVVVLNHANLPLTLFYATSTSRILFKKEQLSKHPFNEAVSQCEEWYLVLELMEKHALKVVPEKLVLFHFRPDSLTHRQRNIQGLTEYKKIYTMLIKQKNNDIFLKLFRIYIALLELKTDAKSR